ncbi:hypothetical protein YO5_06471 [Stutzerimonas stutzeri TS44]|nr:hypothetical protein YO5_06471 [Stutzerimonas stutzeri TS44]
MTAAELIAILQSCPGNTPVLVEGHENGWDAIHDVGVATVVEVVEPAEPDGQFLREGDLPDPDAFYLDEQARRSLMKTLMKGKRSRAILLSGRGQPRG